MTRSVRALPTEFQVRKVRDPHYRFHQPRLRTTKNQRCQPAHEKSHPSVHLHELRDLRGPLGFPVERDEHFEVDKTLGAYADEARARGRIVT
jgi:hypothetical protein